MIFASILAENRLKYRENGTIDLISNYLEKIKNARNFYDGKNFCRNFFRDYLRTNEAF